jgi:glycosyltransferase involved in cell wall biosynthesis
VTDIIFVSMENWDDIWRRNQFVCREISGRWPQIKILFVGLARDVSNDIRRGRLNAFHKEATWCVPELPNVTVTRPLKLLPNTLSASRKVNEAMVRRYVRRVARDLGMREVVLWLNPHSAVHMAGRMGECGVIYDITDDWILPTQPDAQRDLVRRQDAELCRRADSVIVCSQRLFELKCEMARDLHLVPNGVDADHYRRGVDSGGELPEMAKAWAGPVLGYTGTIHPDRVDVELVEAVARKMRGGSVVLVGPNMLPGDQSERLRKCGNVFLPGPVPYAEIPNIMRAFDVCITPHRVTAFTESLNPIKLWEYLAAGKPIVSTDVAGFRDYPQFVRIASGADEFLAAAEAGMREGPHLRPARRAEARRHSWAGRVDQISAVLETCGAKRKQPA